ncbi:unnamed protein product [Gongylonema pulchrum]|uniref:Uncharacterized protein n=1 Tax=Gongylonema pulchrum TaxID=637853 RepID=A0A183E1B1_9BILA|nr:unnamed protein product [Gongylonema pulchrum]
MLVISSILREICPILQRGRERPSLFPNGINPLDAAAERFAKPVPTAVFAARAQSIGPAGLAGIVPVTLLSTPSSILKQNKLTLDLKLEFYEMLAPLRALPEHIFDNLEVAVKAVSLEKRLKGGETHNDRTSCFSRHTVAEKPQQTKTGNRSTDCIALRTRRKSRLSQVCEETVSWLALQWKDQFSACLQKQFY